MYKINSKLATHLNSLGHVDYFLNQGFDAISVRIGLFGGRYFKTKIAGKNYSFKLNELILHVINLISKASKEEKYHLKRIATQIKVLNRKTVKNISSCRKLWTEMKSRWGQKHFDRAQALKQIIDEFPGAKALARVRPEGSEEHLGNIANLNAPAVVQQDELLPLENLSKEDYKKFSITPKGFLVPPEMRIPKIYQNTNAISVLKNTIHQFEKSLPTAYIEVEGKIHIKDHLIYKINNHLDKLKRNFYHDTYGKKASSDLVAGMQNILKHIAAKINELTDREKKELIQGLGGAFSHCMDRVVTEMEDLYYEFIGKKKLDEDLESLEITLPRFIFAWRRNALLFASSQEQDHHNAATQRAVRTTLGYEFGIPPELCHLGANYQSYARYNYVTDAKQRFKMIFKPKEICINMVQLFNEEKYSSLREQFEQWFQKQGVNKEHLKNEKGLIKESCALYYLIKNNYIANVTPVPMPLPP